MFIKNFNIFEKKQVWCLFVYFLKKKKKGGGGGGGGMWGIKKNRFLRFFEKSIFRIFQKNRYKPHFNHITQEKCEFFVVLILKYHGSKYVLCPKYFFGEFFGFFFRVSKKVLFSQWLGPYPPPPLSGRATKKRTSSFAARPKRSDRYIEYDIRLDTLYPVK